jgi:putative ABC transport system substrate-binding protein
MMKPCGHHTERPPLAKGFAFGRKLAGFVLPLISCLFGSANALAGEIAILKSSDLQAYAQAIEGFKVTVPASMTYAEYDLRGDSELGKKLARKIRASDASLVLAVGLKAALAAQVEIVDIPIVYMMILDPSKHHLSTPNMTGTLLDIPVERQFKILRSFLPSLRRLGVLFDSTKTGFQSNGTARHAAASGFVLDEFPVASEKEVPLQLRALLTTADGLWLVPDSTVLTAESVGFILESAMARHVPVIGFSPEMTRLGALLSISVSYSDVGRETGLLARRLLDGDRKLPMKPIPIERLNITVNQKTANFLGIIFPNDIERLIDEKY